MTKKYLSLSGMKVVGISVNIRGDDFFLNYSFNEFSKDFSAVEPVSSKYKTNQICSFPLAPFKRGIL